MLNKAIGIYLDKWQRIKRMFLIGLRETVNLYLDFESLPNSAQTGNQHA
jgi:hypothetical protein